VQRNKKPKILTGTRLAHNAALRARYQREIQILIKKMVIETRLQITKLFKSGTAVEFQEQQAEAEAMDKSVTAAAKKVMNKLTASFTQLFASKAKPIAAGMVAGAAAVSKSALHVSLKKLSGGLSLKTGVIPKGFEDISQSLINENVGLIKSIPAKYLDDVSGSVYRSITQGQGLADLLPQISKYEGITMRRAKLIAHDQTRKAYNSINKARMVSLGTKSFQWVHSGGGHKPRASHIKISGTIFTFENLEKEQAALGVPPADRGIPGYPVNCFTGSTKVSLSNGCRNLWRYRYTGNIVRFDISGGGFFESTLNHPILTLRGWVRADDIQEGEYLISCEPDNTGVINNEVTDFHPTFEEFFNSQSLIQASHSRSGSEFNFHGDIPPEKVDAITIQDVLPDRGNIGTDSKQAEQLILAFSDIIRNFFIPSFNSQVLKTPNAGIFSQTYSFLNGKFVHQDSSTFTSGSKNNAGFTQYSPDDLTAHSVDGSYGDDILTIRVSCENIGSIIFDVIKPAIERSFVPKSLPQSLDNSTRAGLMKFAKTPISNSFFKKVLRLEKKSISIFNGHVYTMESFNGWYTVTPSQIVSKNCGCTMTPVIELETDED
jgi:hypothetical protein